MMVRMKVATTLMALSAGIYLVPFANAQDAYQTNFNNGLNVSTMAGVHMTVPFGGKKSDRAADKPRIGLMLNMTRSYNDRFFYTPNRINTNLLDFGMQFDGRPTMLVNGEDMYTPLFAPLNASGEGSGDITISKNTVLLVAGAALVVGATAALVGNLSDDDYDDDYDDYDD